MTKIADSLKRVMVQEDSSQDEAAVTHIDRTNGADVAMLTINPDLVDAEGLKGYKIRAGVEASLEGLLRYNRRVKSRHGAYDSDERVFREGYTRAREELEELVHLAPRPLPTPAQAKAQLKAWLQDDRLRAALEPLLLEGGADDGNSDTPVEPGTVPPGPDGSGTEGGSKRSRRSTR